MGTLTGQYIADGAWTKANEAIGGAATRWPTAEALRWLNNGQREIVNRVPAASSRRVVKAVAPNDARNTFESLGITDGIVPLDVASNYNAAGTVRGRPNKKTERGWLDDYLPYWRTTPGTHSQHWVYDPRDTK